MKTSQLLLISILVSSAACSSFNGSRKSCSKFFRINQRWLLPIDFKQSMNLNESVIESIG